MYHTLGSLLHGYPDLTNANKYRNTHRLTYRWRDGYTITYTHQTRPLIR